MTIFKKLLVVIVFVLVFASSVLPAFALSSTYYSAALKYYNQNCRRSVKGSLALNCYVFDKVNEINLVIIEIQTNVSTLTENVSILETKISDLQNQIDALNKRVVDLESAATSTTTTVSTTTTTTSTTIPPGVVCYCSQAGYVSSYTDGRSCSNVADANPNATFKFCNFIYDSSTCVDPCTPDPTP